MLALIDGDILAHKACESRWKRKGVENYDEITLIVNRDEFKFSKDEDTVYLMKSWATFKTLLKEQLERTFATDYLMAVKGNDNFRDLIYPIEIVGGKAIWGYKSNRWKPPGDIRYNPFVPVIRELAVYEGLAIAAEGREADDYLRIWASQAEAAGDPYAILSIDKDLECIPGLHVNMNTHAKKHVTEVQALRFEYQQLLSGDSTDNIPGVLGIGPIKAKAALAHTYTEEEMQEIVVMEYVAAYGKYWYETLLANGKLIHLQKHLDDYFRMRHWPVVEAMLLHSFETPQVATAPITVVPAAASPSPSPSPKLAVPGGIATAVSEPVTGLKGKPFTGSLFGVKK